MIAALFVDRGRVSAADAERFGARVSFCPILGCWWWLGSVDKDGYGRFQTWDGAREWDWRAHRFAYFAMYGPPAASALLRHCCDNGRLGCVNPGHLEPGTQSDNVLDAVRRGRTLRGEHNPSSTTTQKQVDLIRFMVASGERQIDVARSIGVSKTVVWQVVHGRAWHGSGSSA